MLYEVITILKLRDVGNRLDHLVMADFDVEAIRFLLQQNLVAQLLVSKLRQVELLFQFGVVTAGIDVLVEQRQVPLDVAELLGAEFDSYNFV